MTPTARVWRATLLRVALLFLVLPLLDMLVERVDPRRERVEASRAAEREQRAAALAGPRSGDGRVAYAVTPASPSERDRRQTTFVLAAAFSLLAVGQAAWWTIRHRRDARQPT